MNAVITGQIPIEPKVLSENSRQRMSADITDQSLNNPQINAIK